MSSSAEPDDTGFPLHEKRRAAIESLVAWRALADADPGFVMPDLERIARGCGWQSVKSVHRWMKVGTYAPQEREHYELDAPAVRALMRTRGRIKPAFELLEAERWPTGAPVTYETFRVAFHLLPEAWRAAMKDGDAARRNAELDITRAVGSHNLLMPRSSAKKTNPYMKARQPLLLGTASYFYSCAPLGPWIVIGREYVVDEQRFDLVWGDPLERVWVDEIKTHRMPIREGAELRVTLSGGTLVLIRAARHEPHGARLRAIGWLADTTAHKTTGREYAVPNRRARAGHTSDDQLAQGCGAAVEHVNHRPARSVAGIFDRPCGRQDQPQPEGYRHDSRSAT